MVPYIKYKKLPIKNVKKKNYKSFTNRKIVSNNK